MKKVVVLMMLIFAVGCAKKYVKAPEETMEMEAEEEMMEEMEVVEERITPEEPRSVPLEDVTEKAIITFKDALFDFDKYNIRPDARQVLDSVAVLLNRNKDVNVLIEGHCDERGTNEYNLALGEKRAKAARDYLITRGVRHIRMNTISYGEERPVCTAGDEPCWQRNRRAHFVVVK